MNRPGFRPLWLVPTRTNHKRSDPVAGARTPAYYYCLKIDKVVTSPNDHTRCAQNRDTVATCKKVGFRLLGLARRVENRDLRSKLSLGNTWLDLLYNLCGTYVASAPGEPHISRCSSHFLALLRDFPLRKRPRMNPYPRSAPKLGGWATWSGPIAGRHNLRWSSTDQPATWKQLRRFSFLI